MTERTYEIDGSRYAVVLHDNGSADIFNADTGEHLNEGEPWFVDEDNTPIEDDVRWLIENTNPTPPRNQ